MPMPSFGAPHSMTTQPTTATASSSLPSAPATLADAFERLVATVETLHHQQENLWTQSEALTRLLSFLQPSAIFPATRGWAASPDFLLLLAETILQQRPAHIVEASSGVTTLVSAYCLKHLGNGHVTSFEHDKEYARTSTAMLAQHGLTSFATVIHAPLVKHEIEGELYNWYDIPDIAPLELLVVDGPPGTTGPLARFPAVPLLRHAFMDGTIVLVDDGARPPENEMVRRWCAAEQGVQAESFAFEKGAFKLTF